MKYLLDFLTSEIEEQVTLLNCVTATQKSQNNNDVNNNKIIIK